ncbi:MAG: peptidylprolyl isomerase [Verrucomicrobiota bacterium]|nr:peptidylprolyl isomerase [Verrucomicrobiota bacterium]
MLRSLPVVLLATISLPLFALAQTSTPPATTTTPEVINGIAAIVNDEAIPISQVRELSAPKEKLLHSQFSGNELVEKIKEARKAALQDLIDRQLIIQSFRKEGFQIPDHFLDERIKEIIKENFGGDRNTFIKTLQAQNYTLGEFRKIELEKIAISAMRGKNVKLNTIVAPSKVEEYYRKHRADYTTKEQIKLRMIMIPSHGSDHDSQKAMAEEILAKLVHGAEFDRMAQIYSEDSTRDQGGDWGIVERGTLTANLEKVAFNLPVGKVSNIVEVGGNFYILKVEARSGGDTRSLSQVRDEIAKKVLQEEAQAAQEHWIAGLRQKAYIKTF